MIHPGFVRWRLHHPSVKATCMYINVVRGRDGLASSKMDFIHLGTGLCYCWSYFMEITSVNVLRALGQNLGIRYAYAHYLTFVPGRVNDYTLCFDWLLV